MKTHYANVYVARQPIFDCRREIYAYELLFRGGMANFYAHVDGDQATSSVLANSLINIGIDTITGGKKSFVNFTRNLLVDKVPLLLPRENVVVEILEDMVVDGELLAACREISRQGYLLALDDFTYTEEMEPLIELADIIKFDFRLSSVAEIEAYLEKLAGHQVKLLAEKVETIEEFNQAVELGFELFQGYFFCKPEVIEGREIAASQVVQLQIMAEINKDDFDFNKVEELVSSDVGISYKLLRYINSPYFARPGKIEAIKQALVYMGADEMRRFISLMAISKLAADKPRELINLSCIRGKFCELLGRQSRYDFKPSILFTVGMFSLMDAIMDQPMVKVMEKLPLAEELVKALVGRRGILAGFLVLAIAYEQGRWTAVKKVAAKLGIDEALIPALYAEACDWNNRVAAAV